MIALILFLQVVIIFFMIICFVTLKQQHEDINTNISLTRRYIHNLIEESYENKN